MSTSEPLNAFLVIKILKQVEDESARRIEHFYQVPEMINSIVFFTRINNDMDSEG